MPRKYTFQRNLFGQDDPVLPTHLQFFSRRISAIPTTWSDWGCEARSPMPSRSYATAIACTRASVASRG